MEANWAILKSRGKEEVYTVVMNWVGGLRMAERPTVDACYFWIQNQIALLSVDFEVVSQGKSFWQQKAKNRAKKGVS